MSVQHRTAPQVGLQVPTTWPQMWRVAWARAWAFTGVLRRDAPERIAAARSWTWQWAGVAWQAAAQFPAHLIISGWTSRQTVLTPGGSAWTVRVGGSRRPSGSGAALAVLTAVVLLALMVAVVVGATLVGPVLLWPAAAAALLWLVGLGLCAARPPSPGVRVLSGRAAELAGGAPAVVVSSVVADRQCRGAGTALMAELAETWADEGIGAAVLWAGSEQLVSFYRDRAGGWRLDGPSRRRMVWRGPEGAR